MASFPQEIIIDILCRLAVKDLLRYRSVSKQWRSLIDDPHFAKLHLHHSTRTRTNLGVVLRSDSGLSWVDLDGLDSAVKLHNPIDDGVKTEVVGSCNGLLVLKNSSEAVALWNPSTRRYRNIPIPRFAEEFSFSSCLFQNCIIGFGYDPVTDDYKLLRMAFIMRNGADCFKSEFKIYSLRNGTWKRVSNGLAFNYCFRHGSVFVSNALHWIVITYVKSNPSYKIVMFDLVTEEFNEVPPPDYEVKGLPTKLVELEGCLCVACNYMNPENIVDRVDIWMMKEYRVKESWTKLFSVVSSNLSGCSTYVALVAFLKSNDQILLDEDGEDFYLYELQMNRVKNLKISGVESWIDVLMCVASLIGLNSTTDGESNPEKQARENGN